MNWTKEKNTSDSAVTIARQMVRHTAKNNFVKPRNRLPTDSNETPKQLLICYPRCPAT
ncbi:hypothetical protein Mapa_009246 [Marchantia paleacea]|nr:hypothetical protein Mapa_009246 [Marchantia paleacea]